VRAPGGGFSTCRAVPAASFQRGSAAALSTLFAQHCYCAHVSPAPRTGTRALRQDQEKSLSKPDTGLPKPGCAAVAAAHTGPPFQSPTFRAAFVPHLKQAARTAFVNARQHFIFLTSALEEQQAFHAEEAADAYGTHVIFGLRPQMHAPPKPVVKRLRRQQSHQRCNWTLPARQNFHTRRGPAAPPAVDACQSPFPERRGAAVSDGGGCGPPATESRRPGPPECRMHENAPGPVISPGARASKVRKVERIGIEPMTFRLQSGCSPS
jgi:hypothetical protein